MRAFTLTLLLAVVFGLAQPLAIAAETLFVDPQGGGDVTDIQGALDAASDGDTVLVKPGEYVITEPLRFNRQHDPDDRASPPLKNLVVRAEAGAEATILRMHESPLDSSRASVVIFERGETEASVLEGFTVTGGQGTRWRSDQDTLYGGGIFCLDSSPSVSRCTISGNSAQNGGGVYSVSRGQYPRGIALGSCLLSDNIANCGGGLYTDGYAKVVGCKFQRNSAGCGGAVTTYGSTLFMNTVISGNTADNGGAVYAFMNTITLINCTIHGNRARETGGAFSCGIETDIWMTNCILWENTAPVGREFDFQDHHYSSDLFMTHSLLDGSPGAVNSYTGYEPERGPGSIDADPAFVAPGLWEDPGTPEDPEDDVWILGDYRLQAESPCVDTGTPTGAPGVDIADAGRPCGAGVDVGAHERGDCPASSNYWFRRGDCNGDGITRGVADALFMLTANFIGGVEVRCAAACDANGDGDTRGTADAIALLRHNFLGKDPIPPPFPGCGPPTALDQALGCKSPTVDCP